LEALLFSSVNLPFSKKWTYERMEFEMNEMEGSMIKLYEKWERWRPNFCIPYFSWALGVLFFRTLQRGLLLEKKWEGFLLDKGPILVKIR
jgi:hypothetical protein